MSTTLPRPPGSSRTVALKPTGWPSTVIVIAPTREPSAEPFPQATSSLTVTVGPVNLAADSGAGKVREVLVTEPSTEAL
jgi:hypothetical protein